MDIWGNLHGGSTHFPIALLPASFLFDLVGYFVWGEDRQRDLHAAGYYALLLGALASFLAVLSGLIITHWQFGGAGLLAKHHLFVWPSFGLLVALGVWRLMAGARASRMGMGLYLLVAAVATGLILAAGYYGGELGMGGA